MVIVGAALLTVRVTLAVAELYRVGLVGVNVTESVCDPAVNTVPVAGV